MTNWPTVKIGDACEVVAGGTPKRSEQSFWGGEIPWVKISDMLQGHITRTEEAITEAGLEGSAAKLLRPGTVLVSIFATIGRTAVLGCDAATNQAIVGVIPKYTDQFDPRFLEYSLQQKTIELKRKGRGVAQANINSSVLKSTELILPPLAEQKRIAGILDAADALRAKRRESLAQLDIFLQSTFLNLFGDPVTNPMGWDIEPLGEICDVRDGTHDSPKYINEGHPLLTSKNFKDGQIDYSSSKLISDEDFQQINKRSKVDIGDLVMPMIGTIGNPVPIEQEPDFAIKNVALIKFSNDSPDNRFIQALLCSHYFDQVTLKANRGGTQKFVALKDLRGMPIPLPPLELQRHFATIVESVERQKARMRTHLAELDTLFSSLQSRAFNGEL